jgi:hypothetical protein
MKKLFVLVAMSILSGCAGHKRAGTSSCAVEATLCAKCASHGRHEAFTLEFRPASEMPGPGLTEMTLSGSEKSFFVSDEVVLSNADVESAQAAMGPFQPHVEITFTKEGAERFATVTENNLNKPLAIIVSGRLIAAPIVMDKIVGGKAEIQGTFSEEEARRMARGITGPNL